MSGLYGKKIPAVFSSLSMKKIPKIGLLEKSTQTNLVDSFSKLKITLEKSQQQNSIKFYSFFHFSKYDNFFSFW